MRIGKHKGAVLLSVIACTSGAMAAQREQIDKSQFNLFNPTPAALMRAMSTDRPDTTESAYTVDVVGTNPACSLAASPNLHVLP